MDIRAYFTSNRKPSTTPKSENNATKTKRTNAETKTKKIFDSDSDEGGFVNSKQKKKKTPVRNTRSKRILESSDESEHETCIKKTKVKATAVKETSNKKRSADFKISDSSDEKSPVPKKRIVTQKKLQNVETKSRFFKETSATAVFGEEPVKRSDLKLKEIQAKLKSQQTKAVTNTKPQIEDDDADFEAALLQMDEIGDNWVDWTKINSSKTSDPAEKEAKSNEHPKRSNEEEELNKACKNENSLAEDERKEVNQKQNAEIKTIKTAIANSSSKEITRVHESIFNNSNESGYDTLSTDSQNTENSEIGIPDEVSKTSKKLNSGFQMKDSFDVTVSDKKSRGALFSSFKRTESNVSKKPASPLTTSAAVTEAQSDTKVSTSKNYSLWVEKYKPLSSSKIIGQQGDKSNVKKLTGWLQNWYKNNAGSKKAAFVPSGWNKDSTGACFKAALLSGPPGVGKTTTVSLVCKELGFDTVEFNASDTRSKRLLQDEVSRLLKNTSLMPYFSKEDSKESVTKRHILVMDEVDGMAGTEDRGGVQELIQLIKTTKVPIICMCNDRQHPKIRSLVNYCFDLRFARPRLEQIRGFMRTVCFKENLKIPPEALTDVITSANNDIRLILNHLSMLAADSSDLDSAKKYTKLGPWDVLRKVFSQQDHKAMSIHDKCDLFFFDYGIAPLFVQENYLSVKPLNVESNDKRKIMELYARAAECISVGDRIDKVIREKSAWGLLPTQAIFASYAPGEILEGYCTAQINFPSWLGKNSRRGKIDRILQEVQVHTRLKVSASKESINLDYAAHLRNQITGPLIRNGVDGVKSALDTLHEYQLVKEDLDSLHEICNWPNSEQAMASVESKVKAAFTRMYNKNPPIRPYSLTAPVKKGTTNDNDELDLQEEEQGNEGETSDDEGDAMIMTKKKQPAKKQEVPVASTSKAKTKGVDSKAKPKAGDGKKRGRKN